MLKNKTVMVLTSLTALLSILGCAQTPPGQIPASEVVLSEIDSISMPNLDQLRYGSQLNEFLINNWTVNPGQNTSVVCNKGADVDENSSWLYCKFNIEKTGTDPLEQAAVSLVIKPESTYQLETGKAFLGNPVYETHYVYDISDVIVTER